jgi:hypothetical protein
MQVIVASHSVTISDQYVEIKDPEERIVFACQLADWISPRELRLTRWRYFLLGLLIGQLLGIGGAYLR